MAGVHWLEAAQQVSAVRLLAQVEDHQLCANLQYVVSVCSVMSLWSLQSGLHKQGDCL